MYFLNIRSENVWFIYFVEFNTFYKVKIHSDNHIFWFLYFISNHVFYVNEISGNDKCDSDYKEEMFDK